MLLTSSSYTQTLIGLIVGILSFIILQFSFIPQFIKLIKTKNSSGISLPAIAIYTFAYIFYFIWSYGFYFNNVLNGVGPDIPLDLFKASLIPTVVNDTSGLFLLSIILCIKIHYVKLARKMGIDELKLSEVLLKKHKNDHFFKKYNAIFFVLFVYILIILVVVLCLTYLTDIKHGTVQDQWFWLIIMNLISTGSGEIMFWCQFVKTLKSKDTSGISLLRTIFSPISAMIFFTYNLYLGFARGGDINFQVIFGLIFNGFIPSFTILGIKIYNVVKSKKLGLTEIEYIKKKKRKNIKE